MKHCYNGYKVQGSGDNIYNTWSVMNYLQTEHLEDYWIATAGLHNLSGMFVMREVRRLVSELLDRKNITIKIPNYVIINSILDLQRTMTANGECSWSTAEMFLLFLSDYGYFNPTRTDMNQVSLNIPNNEIYQYLYNQHVGNCRL